MKLLVRTNNFVLYCSLYLIKNSLKAFKTNSHIYSVLLSKKVMKIEAMRGRVHEKVAIPIIKVKGQDFEPTLFFDEMNHKSSRIAELKHTK